MIWNRCGVSVLLAGWLCLALSLAGCCSLPSAPSQPSRAWVHSHQEKSPVAVEFIEPAWDITESADLQDIIDHALRSSPVLRESWAAARQQEANMRQDQAPYYPTLTLGASGVAGRSDNNSLNENATVRTYGPEARMRWLVFDAGGRRASLSAAAERLLESNHAYNQVFQDLLRDVQIAYYALHKAQASARASEDNLDAITKTLEMAEKKKGIGLATQLDVLSAQSEYERALYNLEGERASVEIARGYLAQVIGLPSSVRLLVNPPDESALPREEDWAEDRLQNFLDESFAHRADLASARAVVRAAEYAVQVEASGFWPSLSAGALAGRTWVKYSNDRLDDADDQVMIGYLSLSWTVFDGHLIQNKKRAAEAALDAAREQLRTTELVAGQNVLEKYYTLRSALKKIGYARAALTSAEQAFVFATDSYESGLTEIINVLEAQNRLSTMRSMAVAAENDAYVAYVNMIHAVGLLSGKSQQ